jgi:hypothetical protein
VIILPDKNIPRSQLLLPVRKRDWNLPSRAQQKDAVGNEDQTRFRITARLHDGHMVKASNDVFEIQKKYSTTLRNSAYILATERIIEAMKK